MCASPVTVRFGVLSPEAVRVGARIARRVSLWCAHCMRGCVLVRALPEKVHVRVRNT